MIHNKYQILKLLESYNPLNLKENKNRLNIIDFIKSNDDCFLRSNLSGHITCSAWLISPDEQEVLLTHHKKIGEWIQLGGHADGDSNPLSVALKEAQEESGILGISIISEEIFDLDIHLIPEYKNVPEHYHYDIRFLLKSPHKNYIVSPESYDLAWIPIKNLIMEDTKNSSLRRMALKTHLKNI